MIQGVGVHDIHTGIRYLQRLEIAMQYMIDLNDKWALDGRDPNSYTGIGWVLGKFDRAWNERAIFGKIRYMTSASTKRKYSTKKYIETYSSDEV